MERFFLLTMAGFLPAIANAATDKAEHDLPRPNILWLTFEDTSPQFYRLLR